MTLKNFLRRPILLFSLALLVACGGQPQPAGLELSIPHDVQLYPQAQVHSQQAMAANGHIAIILSSRDSLTAIQAHYDTALAAYTTLVPWQQDEHGPKSRIGVWKLTDDQYVVVHLNEMADPQQHSIAHVFTTPAMYERIYKMLGAL